MPIIENKEELLKKYKLAGKIRFISFLLLLLFLLAMKIIGGYSYLNAAFITLILVEAALNQPYAFIVKRVNLYRFQYYQMTLDILAISWLLYYMGGIEAPLVTIAYYAVILWAGVVSTTGAVLFAVLASVISFSSIVIFEYFGILPHVSFYNYKMPEAQMFSLLFGNISFLFAFGYFSAHSSGVIKFLERKRQEESLRYVHKLLATGHLMGNTAHDILTCFAAIKAYTYMILDGGKAGPQDAEKLKAIDRMEEKGKSLVFRLAEFSKSPQKELEPFDMHRIIEEALDLTWPVVRYSKMSVEKEFGMNIPDVMADKCQLQEVFTALILNSMDAMSDKGVLTIKTGYDRVGGNVEIVFSDTGIGMNREHLKRVGEPFFTTKEADKGFGLGLAIAYGIIERHNGKLEIKSEPYKGTTVAIRLPVNQPPVFQKKSNTPNR